MELTKRIALYTGSQCNADCKFCYYKDLHEQKNSSVKELKKNLEKAKAYGIESIEFTGGEPAIQTNILELIEYAKDLNFKRLGIITNGIVFSSFNLTKAIKKAGIEEVKFSIHSSNPKAHDKIIGVNGSFKRAVEGIKNVKKAGLVVSTSTVISRMNYKDLVDIAKFLRTLKLSKINFLPVNPIINAQRLKKDIIASYSEIAPHLHKALDILMLGKSRLNVEYIPFCFMKGYERYVCNLCQVQYDPDEWDYWVKNRIEYGPILSSFSQILGYANMIKRWYIPPKDLAHRAVIESKLLRFTTKEKVCKKCRYDLICDGLWKSYAKLHGYSELKPSAGKKIKDPIYFYQRLR